MNARRWLPEDPRWLQLGFLGTFLVSGVRLSAVPLWEGPLCVAAALAAQATCLWLWRLPPVGATSAAITGLGLALLLRTDVAWLPPLAAAVAVASKFALRPGGKPLFNPANLGLCAAMLATSHAWVSPSQWRESVLLWLWFSALGLAVVHRAFRSDVSLAFLGCHALLTLLRALYLGEPWAVPVHQLLTGGLLIFAFFMISDPKTTPDHRAGRLLFAAAVAGLGFALQRVLWIQGSLFWALLFLSPVVPLFDRLFRAARFEWPGSQRPELTMPRLLALLPLAAIGLSARSAQAFCGFYVAKADAQIYNHASQVVLAHDGDRNVLTMSNDFKGPPQEFAVVIPVPTVLKREQIHIGDRKLVERIDAYSAPRLVEYFDEDPCRPRYPMKITTRSAGAHSMAARGIGSAESLGVRIEAAFTVGEYDIVILSAKESDGLSAWLTGEGYRLPVKAAAALEPYVRQGMKFFVAKVNLKEQAKAGFQYLRPIQIAYESKKFMLPIRLGMANADGPQDLLVYTLTRKGRVESANYRTVELPTGMDVPVFVKDEFKSFYRALFDRAYQREDGRAVFTEYAWDGGWCDPCADAPLSTDELRGLGVFWLGPQAAGAQGRRAFPSGRGSGAPLVTRLHVRYDQEHFPEDLVFHETGNRTNFQARYVLRHPWRGETSCEEGRRYEEGIAPRHKKEAQALAGLTGWDLATIYKKMGPDAPSQDPKSEGDDAWYRQLWK